MPYFLRIWAQEAARMGAGLSPLPSGSVVACMPPTWRVRSNGVAVIATDTNDCIECRLAGEEGRS